MVNYKRKYLEMKLKYINAKQKAGMDLEQDLQRLEQEDLIEQQYDDLFKNKYIDDTNKFDIKKQLVDFFNSSEQKKWYDKTGQQIPIKLINKNITIWLNINKLPTFLTKTLDQYDYMSGVYDEYLMYISGTAPPGSY